MDNNPKDICFLKDERNLLKFLHSLPLHKFSLNSSQEKMQEQFSEVATPAILPQHLYIVYNKVKKASLHSYTDEEHYWYNAMALLLSNVQKSLQ